MKRRRRFHPVLGTLYEEDPPPPEVPMPEPVPSTVVLEPEPTRIGQPYCDACGWHGGGHAPDCERMLTLSEPLQPAAAPPAQTELPSLRKLAGAILRRLAKKIEG